MAPLWAILKKGEPPALGVRMPQAWAPNGVRVRSLPSSTPSGSPMDAHIARPARDEDELPVHTALADAPVWRAAVTMKRLL